MLTLFVLWCCQKGVICYLFEYCILRCYQSRVIFVVILRSNVILIVLLKQYYSSYNIAHSRCSGLKTIGSVLFGSENCQSNTVLLEYLSILMEYLSMSDTRLLMLRYFQYLVWTLHTSLVSFVLSKYKWCCITKSLYNCSSVLITQVKA